MSDIKFNNNFDPAAYSSVNFPDRVDPRLYCQFLLQRIVKFCKDQEFSPSSLKVLDYGSGPTPVLALGFSSVASDIVLAEYEEAHREYVKRWLSNSPASHDWSFYVKYISELQGVPQESESSERAMKDKIKAVVPCDITLDQFICEGYEGPYDIVFSSLCVENGCKTDEDYKVAIGKLVSLVKKEGYFVLFSTIREKSEVGFYTINNTRLYNYAVKRNHVLKSAGECGLKLLKEEDCQVPPWGIHNTERFTFFLYQKTS